MDDRSPTPTRSVLAVAFAVAVMAVAACTHSAHRPTAGAQSSSHGPAPAPNAPPLTGQRANALAQQLTSGTDAGLRSALVIPTGQPIDPHAAKQFAAIGPINFDVSTFRYIDQTDATVVGHVPKPPAGTSSTWTFTLTYISSEWKVVDGEPDR